MAAGDPGARRGSYVLREQRRRRYAERWASPGLLPNLVDRPPGRRRYVPVAILLVALAALVVGVARPHATVSVKREEATVMLAIDTSRSMGAADIAPSRLAAAAERRQPVRRHRPEEVPRRRRLVLVARAARARTDAPTATLVREAIGALRPGEGTAIGDAVVLCRRASASGSARADGSDARRPPCS